MDIETSSKTAATPYGEYPTAAAPPYSEYPTDCASPTPSTNDTGRSRQRLRPWLIEQINKGDIEGLVWLDQDNLTFKVPWKHFGRPGFNEREDAELFRRWAIHTEKFREGDESDISIWKTRFRCALHKLLDVEEMHELRKKDGENPFRVYRFTEGNVHSDTKPKVKPCQHVEISSRGQCVRWKLEGKLTGSLAFLNEQLS